MISRLTSLLVIAALSNPCVGHAQGGSPNGPIPIPTDISGTWNSLSSGRLSSDGKWISYVVTPLGGEATMTIKGLETDRVYLIPRGQPGYPTTFSPDGRWAAYQVGATSNPITAADSARFEVLDLAAGTKSVHRGIAAYEFSPKSRWLIMKLERPSNQATQPASSIAAGTDSIVIRDLQNGSERRLGAVVSYSLGDDDASLLMVLVEPRPNGHRLQLLDLASNTARVLDSGATRYGPAGWAKAEDRLAVARYDNESGASAATLLIWRRLSAPSQAAVRWSTTNAGLASDYLLAGGAPTWSDDGERLVLHWYREPKPASDSSAVKVEVWHWKRMPSFGGAGGPGGVLHLDGMRFAMIDTPEAGGARFTADAKWAIREDQTPYLDDRGPRRPNDVHRINTFTGEQVLAATKVGYQVFLAPNSKWFLYLGADRQLRSFEFETDRTTVLNTPDDILGDEYGNPLVMPGSPRWSKDGSSVLFNGAYDLWQIPLDGSTSVNLTQGVGREKDIAFRFHGTTHGTLARLSYGGGEERIIDLTKPIIVGGIGMYTKASGYWRIAPGERPEPLIWEDKLLGIFTKAERSDRVLFTRQTFREYPDYWVSGSDFKDPVRVTDANPQLLKDYLWGTNVLIHYELSGGRKLQAILTLPPGYQPGKRYPMVVTQYQMLSDALHEFPMAYEHYGVDVSPATYASHGYLVLRPDIPAVGSEPGTIAVEAVTAAVNQAIAQGYADPARIGLQGHSFGGYHAAFIATQSNLFAAIVSGAGITDMFAFQNSVPDFSWRAEWAQMNLGKSFTEAHDIWAAQSPIFHIAKLNTPVLLYAGVKDDNVDWRQMLGFFNEGRRQGKPIVMLAYPDEGHGIDDKRNQNDFQRRMMEFFDHHLKGAPIPEWLVEGTK